MRCQQGILGTAVGRAAGPAIGCGIIDHPCAYRVEVDVAVASEHVLLAVDQTGFVTTFPQRAGTSMAGIEQSHVLTAKLVHHAGNAAFAWWCDQHMDVVVHENVGMQSALTAQQRFSQQGQVSASVGIVKEAGQPVVAALDDVLWNTG